MTIGRIIDVSSAQHPNGALIDWDEVAKAGVTTALIKATQGTTYTNPFFATDLRGARAAGLDALAYHFADFTSAAAEAAYFISVAGALAAIGDFETSENVAWMRTFLQSLERPADKVMGYGSASTFRSVYQQIPALPWVAAYGQAYPGWGVLWQFTDKAQIAGIPAPVDENQWHGSAIQYETLFGTYDPEPPPPPIRSITPEENPDMLTVFESANDGNRHVFVFDDTTKAVTHFYQEMHPSDGNFAWTKEEVGVAD